MIGPVGVHYPISRPDVDANIESYTKTALDAGPDGFRHNTAYGAFLPILWEVPFGNRNVGNVASDFQRRGDPPRRRRKAAQAHTAAARNAAAARAHDCAELAASKAAGHVAIRTQDLLVADGKA